MGMGCPECKLIGGYHDDWCPNHHLHKESREEIETLKERIGEIETDLTLAIKYLKEAKARFAPSTTNSFVDDLIAKYSEE